MVNGSFLFWTIFLSGSCILSSFAQGERHVKWTYNTLNLSSTEVILILTADVEPPWHLYSQYINDGGPQPTRIRFDQGGSYLPLGNAQEKGKMNTYYDDLYEMEVTWYAGVVTFNQKIKMFKPSPIITGKIEYMICTHQICIPTVHEFNIHVRSN